MKKGVSILAIFILLISCNNDYYEPVSYDNPQISLNIPFGFPELNNSVKSNVPTKYGVELGEKLFQDKRLSADNSISCSSCHIRGNAFADNNAQAVGIENRLGLRNVPAIQNMMFLNFYNWDGNILQLENQPLVPIITHEEMGSSILEVIGKIKTDLMYRDLFRKVFGDETVTAERIYKSIAQYEYTLISANSKYDRVKRNEGEVFTENEAQGYQTFQKKCASCHSTELFTDQSFRNIGFPVNPNTNEAGRGRVTGLPGDYMSFRVPSLRNVEYTAPYGSFGQFPTLRTVLDYFDKGVLDAANLDPVFKNNGNKIPLSEQEKTNLILFMKTLSDREFAKK
ncbi:cytochrome-c peroxidase [Chryseobacterium rhizosphaerae]|uniref:Cytochrome-c peroxidase n=1 Tax=Chryseobacterium rhizosphaerae TaxID=395937 RepID=A0ABX9IED8_9FLAO|nr:cytochrome-c peroxidase [Chryseobacterium rhizosphaerae]REC70710.1 cytochrome-c peroxidase [Chryseobacterium rhizosphaerae]GEN67984.1 cytochrome-c peroxidase [Chryseobacterium rhizosphaerae]